jgi:hypothetical protein
MQSSKLNSGAATSIPLKGRVACLGCAPLEGTSVQGFAYHGKSRSGFAVNISHNEVRTETDEGSAHVIVEWHVASSLFPGRCRALTLFVFYCLSTKQ